MVPDSPTIDRRSQRLWLPLAAAALLALVASGLWYALSFGWVNLFIENSWIELVQLGAWLGGACWAWWRIPRLGAARDRWMLFWLAVIMSLAAAREQDLQKYLNPDRFGDFGVSFRIAWWLDGSVPLALKIGWVVLFLALLAALTVPLLRARPRLIMMGLGRDLSVWLFGLGGGFLVLGYGADDLYGRGQFMPVLYSEILEECFEAIGAVLVVASAVVTGRTTLDAREARARGRLPARWRRASTAE